jgi:hypothetical protein
MGGAVHARAKVGAHDPAIEPASFHIDAREPESGAILCLCARNVPAF